MIVGLTSHEPDEYAGCFPEEPDRLFSIVDYNHGGWFEQVLDKISFLISAKSGLLSFVENNFDTDVVIVAARKKGEYDPIVAAIEWAEEPIKNQRIPDMTFSSSGKVLLDGSGELIDVTVVCLGEMGMSYASAVCASLICRLRPRFFAMLGMCCGFKDKPEKKNATKFGDMIIARNTANWDEGKYKDDEEDSIGEIFFHNRAVDKGPLREFEKEIAEILESESEELKKLLRDFYSIDPALIRKIRNSTKTFKTAGDIHYGHLLSGASVIDSVKLVKNICDRFPRAIGLEMEAHAVYSAYTASGGAVPDTLVIKGVADHGDGSKGKAAQPITSAASAKLYFAILDRIVQRRTANG